MSATLTHSALPSLAYNNIMKYHKAVNIMKIHKALPSVFAPDYSKISWYDVVGQTSARSLFSALLASCRRLSPS